jgi:hypothetical protein
VRKGEDYPPMAMNAPASLSASVPPIVPNTFALPELSYRRRVAVKADVRVRANL